MNGGSIRKQFVFKLLRIKFHTLREADFLIDGINLDSYLRKYWAKGSNKNAIATITITAVQIANTHTIQTLSQILNSLKYEPLSDINRRIYLDCRLLPKEVLGHR